MPKSVHEGVEQDHETDSNHRAAGTRAAEQGIAQAQHNLGLVYARGEGVPVDDVQAHLFANLAAANGYEEARELRDLVAERMTPEQIAEAQRLAREWWEKHENESP